VKCVIYELTIHNIVNFISIEKYILYFDILMIKI